MADRLNMRLFAIAAALAVASCGGGGGAAPSAAPAQGSIAGQVVKGPVAGATVVAYGVNAGGAQGTALGSAMTDAHGAFQVAIGSHAGPVLLRMAGGSYVDEASGAVVNMGNGDMMAVAVPAVAAGATTTGVQLTPLTSMAESMAEHMPGGLTDGNVMAANTAVGAYFMVDDIVRTAPMNPLVPGSGSAASPSATNYGMALAAMSRYAANVGAAVPSSIVTSMMLDASDGVMDGRAGSMQVAMGGGMMGGTMMPPAAGTTGLAGAMGDFAASAANVSGVTPGAMAALMQRLAASDGHIH